MKDIRLLREIANTCSEVMRLYRVDALEEATTLFRALPAQLDEIDDRELRAKGEALVTKIGNHILDCNEMLRQKRPTTLN